MKLIIQNDQRLALDGEGWALIAPFGEHRKVRRVLADGRARDEVFIQVLDNAGAAALVRSEDSLFGRLRRAFVGVPIFKRHPDLADHTPEVIGARDQGAKIPIGTISRMRVGAKGIEALFNLVPDGATAVENEHLEFPSPLWEVEEIGRRGEARVVRPTRLLSVGLTDSPNISGVDSLANANANTPAGTTQQTENADTDTMKQLFIGWLAAQGVVLANDASDQAVLDAVQKLNVERATAVTTLGNEKTTLGSKVTTLENEIATGKTALKAEQDAHGVTKTTLANTQESLKTERKERIEMILDKAVQDGRITAAERPQWATTLANESEFPAKVKELAEKKATVKTATTIGNQGERRTSADGESPRDKVIALANEIVRVERVDFGTAYARVLKEQPALREALKSVVS